MENLNTALGLLVVGMITVFIVLWLVVLIGNLVVISTNRLIPINDKSVEDSSKGNIDSKKTAVIMAAVDIITGGKGNVESIQRK